ncbi:MAG: holo-[acyl-carrier-protein] synthase [candidate division Zixibacteria bacterium RBG_16_43_9]|nr:MAG: holo-[acyl-carrier-protein] synthase [candidate division Zixibacteria bacterium RBG_16_43_9]
MIEALGIDLIEIKRIKKALERWGRRFLERVYTPKELEYCLKKRYPENSLAGRFAAKEAVMKALGTGLSSGVSWREIEILNDKKGKPEILLYGKTKKLLGKKKVLISISHTKEDAIAQAVIIK